MVKVAHDYCYAFAFLVRYQIIKYAIGVTKAEYPIFFKNGLLSNFVPNTVINDLIGTAFAKPDPKSFYHEKINPICALSANVRHYRSTRWRTILDQGHEVADHLAKSYLAWTNRCGHTTWYGWNQSQNR